MAFPKAPGAARVALSFSPNEPAVTVAEGRERRAVNIVSSRADSSANDGRQGVSRWADEDDVDASVRAGEVALIKEHFLGGSQKRRKLEGNSRDRGNGSARRRGTGGGNGVGDGDGERGGGEGADEFESFRGGNDEGTGEELCEEGGEGEGIERGRILAFGRGFRAGVDLTSQRAEMRSVLERMERRRAQVIGIRVGGGTRVGGGLGEGTSISESDLLKCNALETFRERESNALFTSQAPLTPFAPINSDKRKTPLEEMTARDWRIFREDHSITARLLDAKGKPVLGANGSLLPPPLRDWSESCLPEKVLRAVEYPTPSPIQMQAIPATLAGFDVVGIAATGSGKTAAFLLPIISKLYFTSLSDKHTASASLSDKDTASLSHGSLDTENEKNVEPQALILAPSRELTLQIATEFEKFQRRAVGGPSRALVIVGGHDAETQALQLRRGCDLIVATPGRLKDCLERALTVLHGCRFVVLDEGDRMVDMGFEPIVAWILDQCVPSAAGRQTSLFSATMPSGLEAIARKYLNYPVAHISVSRRGVTVSGGGPSGAATGPSGGATGPSGRATGNSGNSVSASGTSARGGSGSEVSAIEQRVEFVVSETRRRARLMDLLRALPSPHSIPSSVMVFVNTKKNADTLAAFLTHERGVPALALHGGKSQEVREETLALFRAKEISVLVATDVAGRGIDVEDVVLVVNFEMPASLEAYTHRIGRSGRAGKAGLAVSFLNPAADEGIFYDLKKFLVASKTPVPHELAHHPAAQQPRLSDAQLRTAQSRFAPSAAKR